MPKKLEVLRNEHASTYAVYLEMGNPARKLVGGLSLDLSRLRTELQQHSCSEQTIEHALQELENSGSTVIWNCA